MGPKWNLEDDERPSAPSFSCVGCFEPLKVLNFTCPSCHWPACSSECAGLTNPDLHDIECALLKIGKGPEDRSDIRSIKEYFRSDALFALKILILQRKNPKKFKAIIGMESNETNRLMTFNFREAEERINYLEHNFLKPLRKAEDESRQTILPQKDKKILHKIYGIIETNAMYISLSTGTEICGLYPTACLLEHSCIPNCGYSFDMKNGFKIDVQAFRDIIANERLTTTYSHILWSTQLRQQHLKDSKYFTCLCKRCKDPTELGTNFSTLRCIGAEEEPCNGYQLPVDPISPSSEWACNKCLVKIANEQVSFLTGRMNEEIEAIIVSSPTPKALEELIEKLSQFLHPTHYHMFTLKHALVQLYGTHDDSPLGCLPDEILTKKLNICNELLQITHILDPFSIRIPIYIGLLYLEKHYALLECLKRKKEQGNGEEAEKCLVEAKKILSNENDSIQGRQLIKKIDEASMKMMTLKCVFQK